MLKALRESRGLTQTQLAELAGVSIRSVSRAEEVPGSIRDLTWQHLLRGLCAAAPLTQEEKTDLVGLLGWSLETLDNFNRIAILSQAQRPPDRRQTARSRVVSVLEEHGDLAEPLAEVIESIARLLTASRAAAIDQERPRSQPEQLAALLKSMAPGTAQPAPMPDPDPIPNPQSPMPSPDDRLSTTRKVVLPAEQTKDGTIIQRFEYYTEDGRRLIPAPPKARKLDRDQQTG